MKASDKAYLAYTEMEKLYARNWSKVAEMDNDQMGKMTLKAERIGIRKCMKILKDKFNLEKID